MQPSPDRTSYVTTKSTENVFIIADINMQLHTETCSFKGNHTVYVTRRKTGNYRLDKETVTHKEQSTSTLRLPKIDPLPKIRTIFLTNRVYLEISAGDFTEVSDSHAPKLMHISETQKQLAPVTLLHMQLPFKDFRRS